MSDHQDRTPPVASSQQGRTDGPERVWLLDRPSTYDLRFSHPGAESITGNRVYEYVRADIHPARCVGDDGIDHQSYTEAALEEAQVVTDLRAENARLREALVKIRRRTGELAIPKVIAAETMLGLWKIANDALETTDDT